MATLCLPVGLVCCGRWRPAERLASGAIDFRLIPPRPHVAATRPACPHADLVLRNCCRFNVNFRLEDQIEGDIAGLGGQKVPARPPHRVQLPPAALLFPSAHQSLPPPRLPLCACARAS